jgi:hypothetical protein
MSINHTCQSASLDTQTGRGLLRKIARHEQRWADEWTLRAAEDTDWKVVFHRRIDGDIGEPDATVDVETDSIVRLHGETGRVKAFSDSQEVTVPPCRSVWLRGRDVPLVAKFLLDGWHLRVTHSAGSTHSSEHGLSFIYLSLVKDCDEVEIGSWTVFVNGTLVCGGACIV